jgi:NADPH-dependent 2,4-dienoyl-CoA reductase/sulfur reductase-like enzyme/peroxiredoxin family protein/rhodanese-related sulfurtransferase/TusA-related sulfurtransferase
MKFVIIGGVAGGATTATRLRRNDESAEIILLERGKYISYANCGLPYYIGEVIKDRNKLFVQNPTSFSQRFNVDVRTESEVIEIIKDKKEIIIRRNDGTDYVESYDKLILSPGAYPFIPPLTGIETPGIFTLHNVEDADRIKQYTIEHNVKRAAVIGAGFIGLEMAENLHHLGTIVSIVEMTPQVMNPIDFSMASFVHQHLMQKKVNLYLEETVEGFVKKETGIEVNFKSGKSMTVDIVILSIGVKPETTLAKKAGLKIGEMGGIWVNEYLQTSDENIYAVGDAIEFPHPFTGKSWLNYLAGPANRQGRIVADNLVFGNNIKYEGAIGTSIAKIFDITVAATGLAAKALKKMGIEYLSSTTHSYAHAGYYPDATMLSIKITFAPKTGKLYGAQIVGYEGVDKRIDQFALIIKNGGTIADLIKLEHAYAPPYSSAKDPVAIAGYVAENILNEKFKPIYWRQVRDAKPSEYTILDVRTEMENQIGSIPHSLNIPIDNLRERHREIPKDKPIIIYCTIGIRGYLASRILTQLGFENVYNLAGGYRTYSNATAPIRLCEEECDPIHQIKYENEKDVTFISANLIKVDACGIQCPGPILKLKQAVDSMKLGEQVEIVATDPGFTRDAEAWCNSTGNRFISSREEQNKFYIIVQKGDGEISKTSHDATNKAKTFIMFSDDLDKALATFVLANGAAATGGKVTIFFTFWGLNVLKKVKKPKVKKDFFGKMFGMMLPANSFKLNLSKLSMFGMGRIMRMIMKKKGIPSLESLRAQALENGVEFIACQMSMDVMGVKKEELIDEATIGGVATYINRADDANINLFI